MEAVNAECSAPLQTDTGNGAMQQLSGQLKRTVSYI